MVVKEIKFNKEESRELTNKETNRVKELHKKLLTLISEKEDNGKEEPTT